VEPEEEAGSSELLDKRKETASPLSIQQLQSVTCQTLLLCQGPTHSCQPAPRNLSGGTRAIFGTPPGLMEPFVCVSQATRTLMYVCWFALTVGDYYYYYDYDCDCDYYCYYDYDDNVLFDMMVFGVVVVVVVVVLVCGFCLNLSYATCNRLYFGAAWPMGCCSISGTASRQTQTNGD